MRASLRYYSDGRPAGVVYMRQASDPPPLERTRRVNVCPKGGPHRWLPRGDGPWPPGWPSGPWEQCDWCGWWSRPEGYRP